MTADTIEEAVEQAMDKLKGAYSLVVMSPRKLIAARDPQGFRPLCIGKLGENDVFASESCAWTAAGATSCAMWSRARSWSLTKTAALHPHPLRRRSGQACACSSTSTSPGPIR
ncbi:MAG: hypothetical protein V8T36_05175 [Ruthenibacterium lactatiformans]